MKIILLQDIKNVGKKDQIINASDGYAKNFLFPRNLAEEATDKNLAKLKAKQKVEQDKKDKEKEEAKEIAKKLETITVKIKSKAGENGKLFGAITSKDISDELNKQYNISIDKKKIVLNEGIKTLGSITVDVKLYEGVTGKLTIHVIPEV